MPADPWELTCGSAVPVEVLRSHYGNVEADMVAFGHFHRHHVIRLDGRPMVNGASVGLRKARLDSARFMSEAHRLYRSLGFRDILPYEGTVVSKEHQNECVFMQLDLIVDEGGAPRSSPR